MTSTSSIVTHQDFYDLLAASGSLTEYTLTISPQPIRIITAIGAACANRCLGVFTLAIASLDIIELRPVIRSIKCLCIPLHQGFSAASLIRTGLGVGLVLYTTALKVAIASIHILIPEGIEHLFHLKRHFLTCVFWYKALRFSPPFHFPSQWRRKVVQCCVEQIMQAPTQKISKIFYQEIAAAALSYASTDVLPERIFRQLVRYIGSVSNPNHPHLSSHPSRARRTAIRNHTPLQRRVDELKQRRLAFHTLVTKTIIEALRKANRQLVEKGLYSWEDIQTMDGKPYHGVQHQAIIQVIDSCFSPDGRFETQQERAQITMPTTEELEENRRPHGGRQYSNICPFGTPLSLEVMRKIKNAINEIYRISETAFKCSKEETLSFIQLKALFDDEHKTVKNSLEANTLYNALSPLHNKNQLQNRTEFMDKVRALFTEVGAFRNAFVDKMICLNTYWEGRNSRQIRDVFSV